MPRKRDRWKLEEDERLAEEAAPDPVCALCGRDIPPHAPQSVHHLVPKLKGGRKGPTALLHQICHNEIHAALTENQLARDYDTPEKLRAEPRLAKFVDWIAGKPNDFHKPSEPSERRKRGRGNR